MYRSIMVAFLSFTTETFAWRHHKTTRQNKSVQQTLSGRRFEFRTFQIRRIVRDHTTTLCSYEKSSQKKEGCVPVQQLLGSHSEGRCIIGVSSIDKLLLAARSPNPECQICDNTFKISHEIREVRKHTHNKRHEWCSEIYSSGFGCR